MFEKILVANRGEIACRVLKTARKMGIGTVAVYSEADRDALHVQLADEAICIGPAPSSQSYLLGERIIDACRKTGAQAVHPGYGFLSENAEFCRSLQAAGIVFIGPGPEAIEAMGDKITSKKLAAEAWVNVIPGFEGVLRDSEHAIEVAADIGYPVMLKASAGGGGKGMRVARNEMECRDGFERAANEARSSFGDDRIFMEKFIEEPRHIEIQVMADGHGNIIYLNERECSLQRRHQKVVEEAPSPFLDPETRESMGEQAVALARAVNYRSAGTVEFIVDSKRQFYFLEMNTRLQVEHPVTELITRLDLVELMIRVASGDPLPMPQSEVGINGWAIETRVYAEDPARNFLPSTGRLIYYRPPPESEHVRVDTGVMEGGEVSIHYDPMIAKLITWGEHREAAIHRMRKALDGFVLAGPMCNLDFLSALVTHPKFSAGDITTHTITEEYPEGYSAEDRLIPDPMRFVSIAATITCLRRARADRVQGKLDDGDRSTPARWVVFLGEDAYPVTVKLIEGGCSVECNGSTHEVLSTWSFGQRLFSGHYDGEAVDFRIEQRPPALRLSHAGTCSDALVLNPRAASLMPHMPIKSPPDTSRQLHSPMPGLLVSVAVVQGQEVKAGEELAVLEAMKMENTLRAERNGIVTKIHFEPGASLEVGELIMEFE